MGTLLRCWGRDVAQTMARRGPRPSSQSRARSGSCYLPTWGVRSRRTTSGLVSYRMLVVRWMLVLIPTRGFSRLRPKPRPSPLQLGTRARPPSSALSVVPIGARLECSHLPSRSSDHGSPRAGASNLPRQSTIQLGSTPLICLRTRRRVGSLGRARALLGGGHSRPHLPAFPARSNAPRASSRCLSPLPLTYSPPTPPNSSVRSPSALTPPILCTIPGL